MNNSICFRKKLLFRKNFPMKYISPTQFIKVLLFINRVKTPQIKTHQMVVKFSSQFSQVCFSKDKIKTNNFLILAKDVHLK